MLRLASDADVHGDIVRGLRRRKPEIDLVRVQDAFPDRTPDNEVLAWSASQNRVLISNDRNTMVGCALRRATAGEPMAGLVVTTKDQSIGSAINDLLIVAECVSYEDFSTVAVIYLPLRD